MAKGQKAKKIISDKILNIFEDSFLYSDGKEIRIPIEEDGEIIQIKVTLTAAKVSARLTSLVKEGLAIKEEIKIENRKLMGYKLA